MILNTPNVMQKEQKQLGHERNEGRKPNNATIVQMNYDHLVNAIPLHL